MLDFIRTRGRPLQLFLLLVIALSFVLVAVEGYSSFTDPAASTVAEVGRTNITQGEWDAAHQRQVEMLRRQMPGIDAKMLDSPSVRRETLDAMVRERVLAVTADKTNLAVSDERLARTFVSDPQFASLRNPDGSVNKDLLAAQGRSVEQFEAALRQELSQRQVMQGLAEGALTPRSVTQAALDTLLQRRDVQLQRFEPRQYAEKVAPTDADIEAYYKAHEAQFRAPEQASIEYVVLDLEAVKQGITVAEADLRKFYEENIARYTSAEERRASHILVQAPKDAPAKDRQAAKAKAEGLLEQVRKSPASFAELAKKNSDDPASAAQGGDLSFNGRGGFAAKELEDKIFAMQSGEVGLVETEFGYHVVQLTGVRGGQKQPFESVRAGIEQDKRTQDAQKKFSEAAEQFRDTVYEQPESLQPVIDKLKLTKRTATVQRTPPPGAPAPLASPKLLDAVFSDDAVRNKRNTDAVETAPNQLVAARVLQHTPARTLPLAEVKDRVRQRVVAQQSAALARKEGEARLAQLKQGGADAPALPASVPVSRNQPQNLPRPALDAVMRADAAKLPAVLGVDLGEQGYLVARVVKVEPPALAGDELKQLQGLYANAWSAAEQQAYYNTLRDRLDVEIKAPSPPASAPAADPQR
jgi:peptidyl-prolyl cis-trans isomerase D